MFFREAWKIFEPNTPLQWNWHHDVICQHLQAVIEGDIKKLAIALPPRHSKSSIVSVAFPAWVWVKFPAMRFLCASYAMSLSVRDSQRCRDLIDSTWYQSRFGHVYKWLPDQNSKSRYENNFHGYRISTSVEGAATGEGADTVICDDAHNIQEGESDAMRNATLNWWDRVMTSRLNDQQTGRMLIIGQRVHEMDLIGHVLEVGGWEYLCLPAEFEPARKTYTCIGWSDPRTREGEELWPAKFPKEVLTYLRASLVTAYFSQYQQRPTAEEGAIIKSHVLFPYQDAGTHYVLLGSNRKMVSKASCRTVITTDFAVSKSQEADYTVFLVWAVTPDMQFILLEIVRDKMEAPESEELLYTMAANAYRLWAIIVEDVAYQKAIIQRLKRGGPGKRTMPVLGYRPVTDKVARLQNIAIYFASQNFYFSFTMPGFAEYKRELTGFPRSGHDDQVDATSILQKLFEFQVPRIDNLELTEVEELAAIQEILQENRELGEFLLEDDFDSVATRARLGVEKIFSVHAAPSRADDRLAFLDREWET